MLKKVQESNFTYSGGPKPHFLLGSIPEIKKGPIEFLSNNAHVYGDLVDFRVGRKWNVQLNHPELIEYVLVKNHKNYRKSDMAIRFSQFLGQALLVSYGEKWKKDRQMLQPLFNKESVEGIYSKVTAEVINDIKNKWGEDSKSRKPVNISKDMSYITMNVSLRTLFGNNITKQQAEMLDANINILMEYVGLPRIFPKRDTNRYLKPELYARAQKAYKAVVEFINGNLELNLKENRSNTILAIMQRATYEDGSRFTYQDLIDQAVNMIFAAYETTSTALQWFWYSLAENPDVEHKLRAELITNIADIDNATYHDISSIEYLDMVSKEAARIYPSFWAIARAPLDDDIIGGYQVKAGTTVTIPIICIHRSSKWWKEPEKFIPERFSKDNEKNIIPASYIPFAIGPRKCIGAKFAEMEIKMVLSKLLPYFSLEIVPGQSKKLKPVISLKKEGDMQMYIRKV